MTYSIVARDEGTGELGVAVQSHWFSVGPIVPWAEPGVGAVATQSAVEVSYGPLALELMRAGKTAAEALAALVAVDASPARRQVGVVDAAGRVAVHTGALCIAEAGHAQGEGFTAQANLMERDTVWGAMAEAYRAASGDLADRMLAALDAAEREGGDIRGRQSAAILVVRAAPSGRPWADRLFDLRVEDHPEPLAELRRLVGVKRAYDEMQRAEDLTVAGDFAGASKAYEAAEEVLGANVEAVFWRGVTLAGSGRVDEALGFLRRAYAADERWRALVARLPRAGLLPDDPALVERLTGA